MMPTACWRRRRDDAPFACPASFFRRASSRTFGAIQEMPGSGMITVMNTARTVISDS